MANTNAKKARRRERIDAERAMGRDHDAAAKAAVDAALDLAPQVAGADGVPGEETGIAVELSTMDGARYVLKRVNDALATHEYLDELRAWVWSSDESLDDALTEHGKTTGLEIRLTPRH